ncbi:hypothetical protein [Klebsiella pneumoniae]
MTTDITELAQRMKTAAEKLDADQWQTRKGFSGIEVIVKGSLEKGHGCVSFQPVAADMADTKTARAIALFSPANVLALVEALEKAQQFIARQGQILLNQDESLSIRRGELEFTRRRIAELESRTVLPDELSGETLIDVASRTDLVYSDDTGILEYTNINGCFVKVTAPPDKVIRFRFSNKRIYMRLVDRVKTHEHAGIIVDFHKNL